MKVLIPKKRMALKYQTIVHEIIFNTLIPFLVCLMTLLRCFI